MKHVACGMAAILGSWLAATCVLAAGSNDLPKGIEIKNYAGWAESLYLNATERAVQAVIVPSVGGRMVHFSADGENILFENTASQGKTLADTPNLWVGGYQCDIGPEIRGLPDHPQLVFGPHRWEPVGDFSAKLISAPDSALGIEIEKEFVMSPDTGEIGVTQRIRNTSQEDKTYCLWDRTACKNGGYVFFPLNSRSRFKTGWGVRNERSGKNIYDDQILSVPQVQILDGVLVTETVGMVTRIGADSDAGWIAYVKGKLLFVKYFPYTKGGNYSDGGNSVEVYFDHQVLEFGPLSPQQKISPGQSFMFPEKWALIELKKEVTSPEQARKLVKKIPSSPFKKR